MDDDKVISSRQGDNDLDDSIKTWGADARCVWSAGVGIALALVRLVTLSGAWRQTKRSIMYLSITLTRPEPEDARELGYLLHKHPDRHQRFSLSLGQAHVFYPEATAQRATAVLMLELDPVQLSRGKGGSSRAQHALEPYVNDRPYVASSFMSVAISKVFASALVGRCPQRPELVSATLDWEVELPCIFEFCGFEGVGFW